MDSAFWDQRYKAKKLVWSAGPNATLVEEVKDLKPGTALDIACGEGRNAIWLAQEGWKVRATDFSPVAIDKASARAAELGLEISFAVQDAAAVQEAQFDLVILLYLHVPRESLRKVVDAAVQAVAQGGTLLILGHDIRNLKEGVGGPQDERVLYGPADLEPLMGELKILRAATIERKIIEEGRPVVALDVLVRAQR